MRPVRGRASGLLLVLGAATVVAACASNATSTRVDSNGILTVAAAEPVMKRQSGEIVYFTYAAHGDHASLRSQWGHAYREAGWQPLLSSTDSDVFDRDAVGVALFAADNVMVVARGKVEAVLGLTQGQARAEAAAAASVPLSAVVDPPAASSTGGTTVATAATAQDSPATAHGGNGSASSNPTATRDAPGAASTSPPSSGNPGNGHGSNGPSVSNPSNGGTAPGATNPGKSKALPRSNPGNGNVPPSSRGRSRAAN